jgi:hypothetical protein
MPVGTQSVDLDNVASMFDMSLWGSINVFTETNGEESIDMLTPDSRMQNWEMDGEIYHQYSKVEDDKILHYTYLNSSIYKKTYNVWDGGIDNFREDNQRVIQTWLGFVPTTADLINSATLVNNEDGTADIIMNVRAVETVAVVYSIYGGYRNIVDNGGSTMTLNLHLNTVGKIISFDFDMSISMAYEVFQDSQGDGMDWEYIEEEVLDVRCDMSGIAGTDYDLGGFADLTQFYLNTDWEDFLGQQDPTEEKWNEFVAEQQG